MYTKSWHEQIVEWSVTIVLGACIIFWLYCLVKITLADGKVDYCYIERTRESADSTPYVLRGHRNWREDRRLGYFQKTDEAFALAKTLNCPIEDK